ncbi:membrane steroid-binding protein 1 [Elaeis guineensis]|uniref:Membrane steroid-binding protein 1 n=1 Tax=Elaeis guineensis var. tenera TaxID=51953 RepID=A0A6I9QHB4_ELAGV|nr:membrane steroid-binding protein 1 [Elaeis guineensis]
MEKVAVAELWGTLKHAIEAYTGLSPATFFTVLALAVAFYYVVSGFFQPSPAPWKRELEFEAVEPLPTPVQLGEITEEELKAYDGSDSKKPLLMAIKGQIYDVTQSRMFYGPGGPYALFAGKDASRALAKMSFEPKDLTGDISGLGPFELDALQDWEYKFMSKYGKVGTIKKTVPVADASTGSTSETTEKGPDTTDISPAESQAGHAVESKDSGQADHGAKLEHIARSEEDSPGDHAEHGAKSVHIAESEEDGPGGQAEHGAKSVHIAESKEDGPAGHGNEEACKTELKVNTPAEHGAETDAADHNANPMEASSGGGTKE